MILCIFETEIPSSVRVNESQVARATLNDYEHGNPVAKAYEEFKILDVSDEEAAVIMIDSNLSRTNITPCEKAMAYKLKYEAILKMEEIHGTPGVPWERRADIAARRMGIGTTTLKRYLHIASLDKNLLTLIEDGKLTVKFGEQISFLTPDVQKIIAELVEKEDIRIKESEGKSFSFSLSTIDRNTFFPGQTDNQIELIINSLIAEWATSNSSKDEAKKVTK